MRLLGLLVVCMSVWSSAIQAQTSAKEPKTVVLTIREVIERNALWFEAEGTKAVVLAHQSGATAESWAPFAEKLQSQNIASIATSGISGEDIEAAVDFLTGEGFEDITLIGASLGGGGVQQAVANLPAGRIQKIILLAPSPGRALDDPETEKLFIYTRQDFYRSRAVQAFEKAAEPKTLLELPGSLHAQDMLSGPHAKLLDQMIVRFILD
ncbi:alpha/beta hydrolase [Labrenzia sp. PHM005]|uniref:alpha/beta hydrolase n=1 Tax=Labrenzia sp. PHM005 TaxID=2590016 RepID=UPI0011407309|nr:alpha/beta hydrolase [Labrenzia sp. PHM005]QDG78628.1 alpha/beta hydrolase [Labrenzia sp. PHM005]